MAQLIEGVTYRRLKNITDWMITEENQREALAQVVNAISQLDITQYWGEGKTSSSDGQRFAMRRKVLQQTYSPKFNDFALEFYSFVADNYALSIVYPLSVQNGMRHMFLTASYTTRAIFPWRSIILTPMDTLKITLRLLPCWEENFPLEYADSRDSVFTRLINIWTINH